MTFLIRCSISLFIAMLLVNITQAQERQLRKKYIFELDITKSMCGYAGSPVIFDDVIRQLTNAIENIRDRNSEIVLSTFQDEIVNTWTVVDASSDSKKKLLKNLSALKCNDLAVTRTNTYAAWSDAKKHLDKNKMNIVFVLTDGRHNSLKNSEDEMLNEISTWDNYTGEAYAFLVELTSEAQEAQNVKERVKRTKNVQIIQGIEFFVLEIRELRPVLNIEEKLEFSLDVLKDNWNTRFNDLLIQVETDHPLLDVSNKEFLISELPAAVKLSSRLPLEQLKKSLPEKELLTLNLKLKGDPAQIKLVDKTIKLRINNKKERVLKLWVVD